MRASQYNFVTTFPKTQEKLLFNTLTTAFVALSSDAFRHVDAALTEPMAKHDPSLIAYLHKNGFLVDVDRNEFQIVQNRNSLGILDENRVDLLVMPNMNCNLACTYCYEEHTKSSMDDETARRLELWLENMIPRFKAILLSWFGGEPMLSYKRIVEIQSYAKHLADKHGTELISHMTTNGYALLPDRAKVLTSLGVHSYQITLDGPAETHNVNRPIKNGGASFERILANACSLARIDSRVKIILRVNYDNRNIDRVPELLALIPQDIRSQIDLVLEPIFGGSFGHYSSKILGDEQAKVEYAYALGSSKGFASTTPQLEPDKLTYCYADRKNQILINYNGDVYKCTVAKFESSKRMGWLDEHGSISWESGGKEIDAWHATPAFEEKCQSCVYAPMCMGGCRKMRHHHGSVGNSCTHPFLGLGERLQNYYAAKCGSINSAATATATAGRKKAFPVWPIKEMNL